MWFGSRLRLGVQVTENLHIRQIDLAYITSCLE